MWVDCNVFDTDVGDLLFVAEVTNHESGSSCYKAARGPWTTNLSHEKVLEGWCGNTNNVSRQAVGLVKVSRVCNGRALARVLKGLERDVALESLGYVAEVRTLEQKVLGSSSYTYEQTYLQES